MDNNIVTATLSRNFATLSFDISLNREQLIRGLTGISNAPIGKANWNGFAHTESYAQLRSNVYTLINATNAIVKVVTLCMKIHFGIGVDRKINSIIQDTGEKELRGKLSGDPSKKEALQAYYDFREKYSYIYSMNEYFTNSIQIQSGQKFISIGIIDEGMEGNKGYKIDQLQFPVRFPRFLEHSLTIVDDLMRLLDLVTGHAYTNQFRTAKRRGEGKAISILNSIGLQSLSRSID